MSKIPKAEATESALSAVEEALKIDFKGGADKPGADGAAKKAKRMSTGTGAPGARQSAVAEPPAEQSRQAAERKGPDRRSTRRAANDDVRSVGNLLYALQRRPSYTPFWTALLLTLVWAGLGTAFGFSVWGEDIAALGGVEDLRSAPHLLGLLIGVVAPIVLFWGMAVLIWRSQEMRMVSRTMTEVALRLAEPENIAKESVVTVSQAIRREVAAMGDGIERALARASELEVLVHNEVASLERSYTDNELRVRRLIDELVTERESIVQNAERVRQAIRGSHDSLSSDLAGVTDQIAVAADSAAKRISDLLAGRSQTITQNIGETGEQVVDLLASRSENLYRQLNEAGDKLSDTIVHRGDRLVDKLRGATGAVADTFAEQSEQLIERIGRTSASLTDGFAERGETLLERLGASSETLTDSLIARGDELVGRFESSTGRTFEAISRHGAGLVQDINQAGEAITRNISARSQEASHHIREASGAFSDAMTAHTQQIDARLRQAQDRLELHPDRSRGGGDRAAQVGRRQDLYRGDDRRRSARPAARRARRGDRRARVEPGRQHHGTHRARRRDRQFGAGDPLQDRDRASRPERPDGSACHERAAAGRADLPQFRRRAAGRRRTQHPGVVGSADP